LNPHSFSGAFEVKNETWVTLKQDGVVFTDANVLAAYFVIHQPASKLSRREQPRASDPFQLRAVFLDTATGSLQHTQDWPTDPNMDSELLPTYDGKFIARAGDRLTLYSPAFEPLREFTLPWRFPWKGNTERKNKWWDVRTSPTGRFLFLNDRAFEESHWFRLDSDTFEELDAWEQEFRSASHIPVGDTVLAIEQTDDPPLPIRVRTIGQPWRELDPLRDVYIKRPAAFLDDRTLVVEVTGGMVVLSTAGEVLFAERFPDEYRKGFVWTWLRTPREGRRIVVSLIKFPGRGRIRYYRSVLVIVYDLSSRSRIFTVEFNPFPDKKVYDFAVSPDGQWLGVMVGSEVRVYRLPAAPQP